jgi:diguanylate cyclase (GGDEF)-like protein/PAS domain S-box-containing protein
MSMDDKSLKDDSLSLTLAIDAINSANDGITITDMRQADQPLIFINKAFEEMTGYAKAEVLGINCRFLQGKLKQPDEIKVINEAISKVESCRVVLKNFTKSGSMFWNELSLAPIKDINGKLAYYVGIQKNVTNEILQNERIAFLSEHDELTALYNYRGFFNNIDRLLKNIANKDLMIAIGIADIDLFKKINDEAGHIKANHILKLIGAELLDKFAEFDIIARFGGDEFTFALLVQDENPKFFYDKIEIVTQSINTSLSNSLKISMSAGVAIEKIKDDIRLDNLIRKADEIMYANKKIAHLQRLKDSHK